MTILFDRKLKLPEPNYRCGSVVAPSTSVPGDLAVIPITSILSDEHIVLSAGRYLVVEFYVQAITATPEPLVFRGGCVVVGAATSGSLTVAQTALAEMYAVPTTAGAGCNLPGFEATINGNGDLAIRGLGGAPGTYLYTSGIFSAYISGDYTFEVTSMRVFGTA